jgi:hypothetical protein
MSDTGWRGILAASLRPGHTVQQRPVIDDRRGRSRIAHEYPPSYQPRRRRSLPLRYDEGPASCLADKTRDAPWGVPDASTARAQDTRSMPPAVPRPDAQQRFRSLVDELIGSWVCWREACEDVRRAYECWGQCKAPQRAAAFASYRAALDREDQAARAYSMHVGQVREARA